MDSVIKNTDKQTAMKVSAVSIAVNLLLSVFKLLAGILAKSGAMISDAVHSASDVFSTIIVMIGVTIAGKKSDDEHQYGHERLECVASIILAVVLLATGLGIGAAGIRNIVSGKYEQLAMPGILAMAAALVSIAVKEWMFWYTRAAAKKINSSALMADAWHHRSDALSSIGAFVGIFGSRLGFPVLDSVASVIICVFIGKASYDIFMDSIGKLVDKSCDKKTVDEIRSIISAQEGVINIDDVRTRLFGSRIYVDVEIAVDGDMCLKDAHLIAERVHDAIEGQVKAVKHCMVHVNPAEK
ncbi:MAG: cation diffusion facilitator family transporter [Oscillospiraceae bacterium]|nr:cation diffusion facilitator family transporter [Oscillospiraceae bacterium]